MNEKKAKRLRHIIFGDRAYRGTQEYVALVHKRITRVAGRDEVGAEILYHPVTVIHKPGTLHAAYRAAKRLHGGGLL